MLVLLALQVVSGPVLPTPRVASDRPCPVAVGDEVVVCARRDAERFRLRPVAEGYAEPPVRAEARLGSGVVAAETEAASVGGFVSNRPMLRLKLPF